LFSFFSVVRDWIPAFAGMSEREEGEVGFLLSPHLELDPKLIP
jgi:hypothetical protein